MNRPTRREALALLGVLAAAACRPGAAARTEAAPPPPPLALDPLVDLVPAAGLAWLVELRPHELLATPALASAVSLVVPAPRFDAFAAGHGGVDLRHLACLVVAGYADATLALARGPVEPARVEAAFAARAVAVEGRAVDAGVTRLWGSVGAEREQVALFHGESGDAVGLERGHLGPLRAAVYFAQGKLRRALPALRAEPLVHVAKLLGEAPVRAFAPGPFEGSWARGLGGLLGATTAVGASLRPVDHPPHGALVLQAVLLGAWGTDAPEAAERLAAAFQLLASDSLGRLLGFDHPLEEARVSGDAEALRLQLVLDPVDLAHGVQAATDARVSEIMQY
jgi:hypothetical protein